MRFRHGVAQAPGPVAALPSPFHVMRFSLYKALSATVYPPGNTTCSAGHQEQTHRAHRKEWGQGGSVSEPRLLPRRALPSRRYAIQSMTYTHKRAHKLVSDSMCAGATKHRVKRTRQRIQFSRPQVFPPLSLSLSLSNTSPSSALRCGSCCGNARRVGRTRPLLPHRHSWGATHGRLTRRMTGGQRPDGMPQSEPSAAMRAPLPTGDPLWSTAHRQGTSLARFKTQAGNKPADRGETENLPSRHHLIFLLLPQPTLRAVRTTAAPAVHNRRCSTSNAGAAAHTLQGSAQSQDDASAKAGGAASAPQQCKNGAHLPSFHQGTTTKSFKDTRERRRPRGETSASRARRGALCRRCGL